MLLTLPPSTWTYAALGATDLRKGFDGLGALATKVVGIDPASSYLFLFCNRRRTQLRVLFWDGTEMCVYELDDVRATLHDMAQRGGVEDVVEL